MKNLMVLLIAFFFSISLVFAQNKGKIKVLTEGEEKIEEGIKEKKEELKKEEKELKIVKKELKMLEGLDVSDKVKENFYDEFGEKTDVVWESDDFYDVATFTQDGSLMKAYYDFDSQLVGTMKYVSFADLPERGQEKIKEEYEEYEVGDGLFYTDNESVDVDFFMFESKFEHENLFLVELTNAFSSIILKVDSKGEVTFLKNAQKKSEQ